MYTYYFFLLLLVSLMRHNTNVEVKMDLEEDNLEESKEEDEPM